MAFLEGMNISASGLTAQRLRLDIISENIANVNTTRTEAGGPYSRKMVVFQPVNGTSNFRAAYNNASTASTGGKGVVVSEVIEDERSFKTAYDPTHPDADENGYVQLPNVDLLKETVDAMEATRAYDANITAFNAIKTMAMKGLEIGK